MAISSSTVIPSLLESFPDFSSRWNEHLKYWEGESPSFGLSLGALVNFTVDLIHAGCTQDVAHLMSFVEDLMMEGGPDVQNAVAVSYLESLVNTASSHPELFEGFVPFLGSESRKFCRAWDEFTGAKTPGL